VVAIATILGSAARLASMGFNAYRGGRVKPVDLALFLGALAVVVALVLWAVL
jgi:hypothetical protein